jgi:LysR family transcriptional regulator, regulator of abg operon
MKLNNIRDVVAVAEAGSLRAASRKIGITQPTMSRSIRDAENELGLDIFVRNVNGAVPTEMGKIFIRHAITIQGELRKIREELAQARGEYTGQVSVAMSPAASIALIPSALQEFEPTYPNAVLRLRETLFQLIEVDILSGEVDFFAGPFFAEANTTSLHVETLFENRRLVVARSGHPLRNATSLEMLRDARWIRPSFSSGRDETEFDEMFERAGLPRPNVVVYTRSSMMTSLAIANSDLLTILPMQWLELSPADQRVSVIPLQDSLPAAPICIIRRRDIPLTPLAEAFYDIVRRAGVNYNDKLQERIRNLS